MNSIFFLCLFLIFPALSYAASTNTGLSIEAQVISRTTLKISAPGLLEGSQNQNLLLRLGPVDAFCQNRPAGVNTELIDSGCLYYQNILITAGSTGGISSVSSLQMTFLPGGNLNSENFFEEDSKTAAKSKIFHSIVAGRGETVIPQIEGIQQFERSVGLIIRPETPPGAFSQQIQYTLLGGGL
ncbi:MAG: hypothetical protein JNK65_02000 [Deltaproteobacteria bacterium]|nr:hypothetical protein [Deltaproteobacteria bacterium]